MGIPIFMVWSPYWTLYLLTFLLSQLYGMAVFVYLKSVVSLFAFLSSLSMISLQLVVIRVFMLGHMVARVEIDCLNLVSIE